MVVLFPKRVAQIRGWNFFKEWAFFLRLTFYRMQKAKKKKKPLNKLKYFSWPELKDFSWSLSSIILGGYQSL